MNTTQIHNFPNIGFVTRQLTNEELQPILDEVNEIKDNFSNFESQRKNSHLAGNIDREYSLTKSHKHIYDTVMPSALKFNEQFDYFKLFLQGSTPKQVPFILQSAWVNFQQKHEFNPTHDHSGVLSYVIWLKIPYNIEDEFQLDFVKRSNTPEAGCFEFLYNDALGKINKYPIPVDKKMEGVLCVFPASLYHQVYPFYTSDEYRITVSGNLKFDY